MLPNDTSIFFSWSDLYIKFLFPGSMFDEELDKYNTYEEYLDSLVSEEDHKYLQDEEMARAIAELGYRYVVLHQIIE